MSEDKKSIGLINIDVGDVTKEIAKPLYKDVAKPALTQVGEALGTVAETVNRFAFGPLRLANHWAKENEEEFKRRISEKVCERKIETLREVPAAIGVPALEGYVLNVNQEELREMFLNLLITAMDSEVELPHPSFPEIIKQITPAEARILNRPPFSPPLGGIAWTEIFHKEGSVNYSSSSIYEQIASQTGVNFANLPLSLSNLVRLGLFTVVSYREINLDSQQQLNHDADEHFRQILNRWTIKDERLESALRNLPFRAPRFSDRNISVSANGRFYEETQLGIALYKACIFDRSKISVVED